MNGYNENRKLFWKEVRKERNQCRNEHLKVMDANGQLCVKVEDRIKRFREYFMSLFDEEVVREAIVMGYGLEGIVRNEYNGHESIRREEVLSAVKKLNNGKFAGVDGIGSELLKYGGDVVVDWVWKLCSMCWDLGVVPEDWKGAVIVPLYKGKGMRTECKNYRGISLLSIVGKVYASILIERVKLITEDRKSTRLNSSHSGESRMPSSA